jgi:NADH:ubiquinone oxidoreductase subunit C
MFNVHFLNKLDARRLLLEYTSEISPLLKNFACEGYEELEYDGRERGLTYRPTKIRDDTGF